MDPTDDEVSRARRRAATVHPVEQKQIQTNDYVYGTPMWRINDDLAFELLAAEAVRHKEPRPERFEVADPSFGLDAPF
jgi:hypothetical protein